MIASKIVAMKMCLTSTVLCFEYLLIDNMITVCVCVCVSVNLIRFVCVVFFAMNCPRIRLLYVE